MVWNDEISMLSRPRSLPLTTVIQFLLMGGLILALLTLSACQQQSSPVGSHGNTPSPISKSTQPSQGVSSLCSKPENGKGVIDKINRLSTIDNAGDNGALAKLSLYDPTQKVFPAGMGRVNLIVTVMASTQIFQQQGAQCQTLHAASFLDLKAGQKLKVWSRSGVVLTSYPAQIPDTSAIVIVP